MAFNVSADAYDRFMGRYSSRLAAQMADLAGVEAGQRVVDVGCGPGALTGELVRRVGAEEGTAADPSEPFVAAVAERVPGGRKGHLVELFRAAGLSNVEESVLHVRAEHETFDDWWHPFTLGVGPAGSYYAQLGEEQQREVREQCRAHLGDGPFTLDTRAWAARGIA